MWCVALLLLGGGLLAVGAPAGPPPEPAAAVSLQTHPPRAASSGFPTTLHPPTWQLVLHRLFLRTLRRALRGAFHRLQALRPRGGRVVAAAADTAGLLVAQLLGLLTVSGLG
ncbi:MAG: hypothetical protein ACP5G2_01685 [Candidatus Bipolaricaulaceae bacterium]